MEQNLGRKGITSHVLKLIAVVTMLIDHTAATILERMLQDMPSWGPVTNASYGTWMTVYIVMRCIGRIAFPIYCFLLAEGFHYTRSRWKYLLRLFLFALISEIPFDMAFQKQIWDMRNNNVFFTLGIGLLALICIEYSDKMIKEKLGKKMQPTGQKILQIIGKLIILLAACMLAQPVLHTDYGACGVLVICIIYFMREKRMLGFTIGVLFLTIGSSLLEIFALVGLIPIYLYNGERGKQHKYFFYVFYPAHLLILSLIAYALGLGI